MTEQPQSPQGEDDTAPSSDAPVQPETTGTAATREPPAPATPEPAPPGVGAPGVEALASEPHVTPPEVATPAPLAPAPEPAPTPLDRASALAAERPEVAVGAAFAGGFLFAMILRRLAR